MATQSACRINCLKIAIAVIEEFTSILRKLLEKEIHPNGIESVVTGSSRLRKLRPEQELHVKNARTEGYSNFDISLLYPLLRHECPKITPPSNGWGKDPGPTDNTVGDDIERIRLIRNELIGHLPKASIDNSKFRNTWTDIKTISQRMDTRFGSSSDYFKRIEEIENRSIDEELENRYMEKLDIMQKNEKEITTFLLELDHKIDYLISEVQGNQEKEAILRVDAIALEKDAIDKNEGFLKIAHRTLVYVLDGINKKSKEKDFSDIFHYLEIYASGIIGEDELKVVNDLLEQVESKWYHGSLILWMKFQDIEGYEKYHKDLRSGALETMFDDVLLNPLFLPLFDLTREAVKLSITDVTELCYHDENSQKIVQLCSTCKEIARCICETCRNAQCDKCKDTHEQHGYTRNTYLSINRHLITSETADKGLSSEEEEEDFYGVQTHDVFLIHSNQTEDKVFTLKILKPMLEEKGLKVMTDEEDSPSDGRKFKSITIAIKSCRKSLIVLTQHSNESSWCSLELLLALEKSHTLDTLSVVILRKGKSSGMHVLDFLHGVPTIDVEGVLSAKRCQEIAEKLRETKKIVNVLPAGNIGHAQVWSHFTGLLQYLLPEIDRLIQETDLYKNNAARFPLKLYELIPENCKCPRMVSDSTGRIKKAGELPILEYKRAGNTRFVTMTVYSVKDLDGTEYYCVAEYPTTLGAIQQMVNEKATKLEKGERRLQIGRFYYTLVSLLTHPCLERIHRKATVIPFNEKRVVLADELLAAIKTDMGIQSADVKVDHPLDRLESVEPENFENNAFIFSYGYDTLGKQYGTEIAQYMTARDLSVINEPERISKQRFSFEELIKQCRYFVLILTKTAFQDTEFIVKALNILSESITNRRIRLIPVLVDVTTKQIPVSIRWTTYVAVDEQKNYLQRLYSTLKGREFFLEKETQIAAGDVAYALAWTYVLNYLKYVLIDSEKKDEHVADLTESIEVLLREKGRDPLVCPKKVFIIIPDSCECFKSLTDADDRIEFFETIAPRYIDISGNVRRSYSFDMYRFKSNGKEYFFVGQYAAPATCLNDMYKMGIAGLNQSAMVKQAKIFCKVIEEILAQKLAEKFAARCEVVSYNDGKLRLMDEMQRRLDETEKRCIKS